MTPDRRRLKALDLFAGTGWGVACQRLGIEEFGVELMFEAIATREANGMNTIYADVWDGLRGYHDVPEYDILIASPPCQTFSMAGSGKGRAALDQVLAAIDAEAYKDVEDLHQLGEETDPRTALVLTPLAHAYRDRPEFIVFEQVPPVLPVWEACADVLRALGYSVWTGHLTSEMYGVPQTRKRAILIARLHGEAKPPTPTHSRYYSRDPQKLDPDVLPWVSMADALGWGMTKRPYLTVASGTEAGGTDPAALGGSGARRTVYAERERGDWAPSGDADNDGGVLRLDASEAATLQSYVMERHRGAGMLERHGERGGRPVTEPALTITGNASGTTPGGFAIRLRDLPDGEWPYHRPSPTIVGSFSPDRVAAPRHRDADEHRQDGDYVKITPEEAAALQSYPSWSFERPATTVLGDCRIAAAGHHDNHMKGSYRATIEEAAALQSYPARPFIWVGSKGKQFLQIGNAVPPLLAEAILQAVTDGA